MQFPFDDYFVPVDDLSLLDKFQASSSIFTRGYGLDWYYYTYHQQLQYFLKLVKGLPSNQG